MANGQILTLRTHDRSHSVIIVASVVAHMHRRCDSCVLKTRIESLPTSGGYNENILKCIKVNNQKEIYIFGTYDIAGKLVMK